MSGPQSASPDALLHLVTLKLLSDAGFPSTSRAASLTLSTIAARYIRLLGNSCADRAALAGRSKVGAGDVVEALEEYGQGLQGVEEWLVRGHAGEGGFAGRGGTGFETLGAHLQDGLDLPEALSELKLVRADTLPREEEDDDSRSEGVKTDEEEAMGDEDHMMDEHVVEIKQEPILPYHHFIRPRSPDMSWLPPLPGETTSKSDTKPSAAVLSTYETARSNSPGTSPPTDTSKLSLIDKYRTRQAYSSSQLAQSNFSQPIPHPSPPVIPPATSSFPLLLETYQAIAGEPSVSLAQTQYRVHAADLLRRVVAPPDIYGTSDSLSGDLPGPGLVLGPSASDTLPMPLVPVNPRPRGILSQLVREMRSPYLPPSLRDRLTTLRPPTALNDEHGQPVYYGAPVRGPDTAALNAARGKPVEEGQEAFYRYTYDAGPRGVDKWGNGELPSGKKVVLAREGEERPRTVQGKKADGPAGHAGAGSGSASGTIKLRLDRSPSFVQPSSPLTSIGKAQNNQQLDNGHVFEEEHDDSRRGPNSTGTTEHNPAIIVSNGTAINGEKPRAPGVPKLRISTSSLSPNPRSSSAIHASPDPISTTTDPAPHAHHRISLKPPSSSASPRLEASPAHNSQSAQPAELGGTVPPPRQSLSPSHATATPPHPGPLSTPTPTPTFWQKSTSTLPAPPPPSASPSSGQGQSNGPAQGQGQGQGQSGSGSGSGGLKLRLGAKKDIQG